MNVRSLPKTWNDESDVNFVPHLIVVYSLIQPLPSPALFRPIDRGQTVHSAYNTQIKEADLYVP